MSRGLGIDAIDESLWTEDGPIFADQAFRNGVRSLWTPYQGFMHTFQRLCSLAVLVTPLSVLPWALFLGWCLGFAWMVSELVRGLRALSLHVGWISLALLIVVLQPHDGEAFFSITNAQWVVGLALAFHVCIPRPDSRNALELMMLAIASVTGPFSVLLLPILAVQLLIERDWRSRWRTYTLIAIGACVQLPVLLTSDRLQSAPPANDWLHWVRAAGKFATFGASSTAIRAAALAFWIFVAATLVWVHFAKRGDSARRPAIVYLFLAALGIFAVSLYSTSLWMDVATLTPVGHGGRYYFIPYALLFVGAVLVLHERPASAGAAFALLTVVCVASFHSTSRDNMQWPAFARFAAAHAGVTIPINPQNDPMWVVTPPPGATTGNAAAHAVAVERTDPRMSYAFSAADCAGHATVGLEAQVRRDAPGPVYLRWGSGATPEHSLLRYYPEGLHTMQFAIRREPGEDRFELAAHPGGAPFTVERLTMYCL